MFCVCFPSNRHVSGESSGDDFCGNPSDSDLVMISKSTQKMVNIWRLENPPFVDDCDMKHRFFSFVTCN